MGLDRSQESNKGPKTAVNRHLVQINKLEFGNYLVSLVLKIKPMISYDFYLWTSQGFVQFDLQFDLVKP